MSNEVDVIEGNKLINIFMHGVLHDGTVQYYEGPDNFQHEGGAFLKYHKDWNWLMPVVEKICKMRFPEAKPEDEDYDDTIYLRTFGALTEEGKFMVRFNRHVLFEAEELIEAAYPAVLDVIENLHNNNSTHTQ
jgi:hypothetical protein